MFASTMLVKLAINTRGPRLPSVLTCLNAQCTLYHCQGDLRDCTNRGNCFKSEIVLQLKDWRYTRTRCFPKQSVKRRS